MTTRTPPKPLLWTSPPEDAILAAFRQAFAERPDVITLTVILKLRTQREKEALLDVTQKRITNMLHDVTVRFFDDLEKIDTGTTSLRLVDAIIDLVASPAQKDKAHMQAVAQLREALCALLHTTTSTGFIKAFIAAVASADTHHPGWELLRQYLEQWYTNHADKKVIKTIEAATQATKTVKVKDEEGKAKQDSHGQPIIDTVHTYTPIDVQHIKFALALRRALVAHHAAQVVTTRAMGMTVLALRQRADEQVFAKITRAVNQRCAGKRIQDVIALLVDLVSWQTSEAGNDPAALDAFQATLVQFKTDMDQETRKLSSKRTDKAASTVRPLLLRVVDALVCADENAGIIPLQVCLQQWYNNLAQKERTQRFSTDDLRLIAIARDPASQGAEGDRCTGIGVLLWHWLQQHCTLSTDVLLFMSLGEKIIRRLGDGDELLAGILANCYGEVCSSDTYPVSSVLRESVFANRSGAILGWCQLVADYLAKRNRQLPGNKPPPRNKGEPKHVSPFNVFQGKRVVRIDLAYRLWKREDAAYQKAIATTIPVGPDEGKTLGNPNSHAALRRQVAGNRRRRTTILGRGVVGKKGARRIKKWLLSHEVRSETLTHLEVLLYPQLDWSEEIRVAAQNAPHPYWVKRTRRGITAVRPTQFRIETSTYPQRLATLSREQHVKLREELREQERYAPQFEAFSQTLDRFLEPAPPAPPFIAPIVPTEADLVCLPPEAQLGNTQTFELHKARFDQEVNWYRDFMPSRSNTTADYSNEKLYDIETTQNRAVEWSAATLARSYPQPIAFKRRMQEDFKPRSFALLYYLRRQKEAERYRFSFVCDLVGETADEREALLAHDRGRGEHIVENFFVNQPDQRVDPPKETTLQYFATQMGADHQERILLEYMDWRRREPENTKHMISTARIVSHRRSNQRTDWYAHLPVPLPVPTHLAAIDAVIGFHEHEGTFYYAVITLTGELRTLGEIELPAWMRPRRNDGMTHDNSAFETAVQMVRRSITHTYAWRFRDNPVRYTAYIGIEDTGWKHDLIGTEATYNRQNASLPRQRIFEIVAYKAVYHGLPTPLHVSGIAPSRDCGHCGARMEGISGIERRAVTHCFHCKTMGIHHTLTPIINTAGEKRLCCTACKRIWQEEEPQFKCQHCRTQQYARYNTALATVHRTVDILVGRKFQHTE